MFTSRRFEVLWFGLGFLAFFSGVAIFARQPLSFEERVKTQEAIERVYYNHRIWPKENPSPKPPFEQMVPRAQIEAKVTDYLKKSAALDQFWQRPITGEQLQAEIDRMAKGTKDPATLKEVFAALHNDPAIIAECLARPILADRLARSWYANDERFHSEAKKKAVAALASIGSGSLSLCTDGRLEKVVYVLKETDETTGPEGESLVGEDTHPRPSRDVYPGLREEDMRLALDAKAFARELERSPEEGKAAILRETPEEFLLVRSTLKTASRIEVETLAFSKEPLEGWLKDHGLAPDLAAEVAFESLSLPLMPENACAGGWNNGVLDDVIEPRVYHTAIWTGAEMIIWGGGYSTGGQYSPSTDTWMPTSAGVNCPSIRSAHAAVWTGSEMIVWGGVYGDYLNTGGRYNPTTNTWIPTSTGVGCPSSRQLHTAVWTGSEMIVWGGSGASTLNTGGRYNPSSDSWTQTSTGTNCPSARDWHTTVWTGTEMIVWGGYYYQSTGGRYNPSTDTWTPISTGANCPIGRQMFTAIWTGTEMIVWGGSTFSVGGVNTGGRYNPLTDAWVSTSTAPNCPSGRLNHTAVWTGSEMIVWGAGGDSTGGRYYPSSDTWSPTSTGANVPSARSQHTAVWTGTEMLVWGGIGGGNLNTGGRYNPISNSWVPTWTPANVPSARRYHTAVWTGTEIIVWGGDGGNNTGGRYYPSTDFWIPTSTGTNNPSARYYHTAVWTGIAMIVWGGGGAATTTRGGAITRGTILGFLPRQGPTARRVGGITPPSGRERT